MKSLNNIFFAFILGLLLFSCKKENSSISDLDTLRKNNNKISYPVTKMDSAQAISSITKQKIQELFDLSTLYTSGNRDTEIDSIIYSQINNYFLVQDSQKLKPIFRQLDSLKVKSAKVGNIEVRKEMKNNDTLDFAKFDVEYFDKDKRSIGIFNKNTQYILKAYPIKFKKEFKFYFVSFDIPSPKDSISVGKTK
ncbi:hypothetical protein [Halpernia frigidisoli]|uniref:Uncharacterized protein n=1 Tax=Halpernia frigidisoli TaxID=1125876 RepID=A0A1I3J7U8_9FLAO|nr:hypothetical protein [Halpernia frigidisoli]SFI56394.1 hypothetical protein SAMN05443292_2982 [Halpernia frigidisoli]